MTEVDFYVLGEANDDAVLRTACRLTQKAWNQGLRIYVLASTDEQAARMDDLLWTFQQDSFVPHERWHGTSDSNAITEATDDEMGGPKVKSMTQAKKISTSNIMARVLIGTTAQLSATPELLVNLGAPIPEWFAQCPRVVEIISAAPHRKAEGRQRYRAYRDQGVPLRTHEV